MYRLETFSPVALQPFVSYLINRGIPSERYLQQNHIPVELLEHSTESIHDIARVLGYSTTGNFSRAFQRMSGLPPTKYRQSDRVQ